MNKPFHGYVIRSSMSRITLPHFPDPPHRPSTIKYIPPISSEVTTPTTKSPLNFLLVLASYSDRTPSHKSSPSSRVDRNSPCRFNQYTHVFPVTPTSTHSCTSYCPSSRRGEPSFSSTHICGSQARSLFPSETSPVPGGGGGF